ncbi:MAG TPA: lysophospholipid acyltransferase family protein [Blastocatellia bacterium]|nr:lysophospholipid acyltransferase family protein [Blastocatellia bacterium]
MFITRQSWFTPPPVRFCIMLGFRAVGVRFEVKGAEHLDPKKSYMIVANHQSIMDIPALFNYLPGKLGFLGKKEVRNVPILGVGAEQMGMIFIDRKNREQARKGTEKIKERLRQGMSFIVFPEGTRSDDGRLLPFKKGAFHIAYDVGASVVPVTIKNAYQIMPKRGCRVFPGVIHVYVHPPVDSTDYKSIEELKVRVAEIVASELEPELLINYVPQPA